MVMGWLACGLAGLAAAQLLSPQGEIVRGPSGRKQIALVFTGHEYAEGGEAVLDALARRRAQASFFLTGDFLRNAAFRPLVKRLIREGHYLGPHSDRHLLYCDWSSRQTLVSRETFRGDLEANAREIARLGGRAPSARYFLPAYEWCNAEIVGWARELGYATVNFTVGTRANADYTEDGASNYVSSAAILESIRRAEAEDAHGLNGFILLLHVGAGPRRTDKLHAHLAHLLDSLSAQGYEFVRIDRLLGDRR